MPRRAVGNVRSTRYMQWSAVSTWRSRQAFLLTALTACGASSDDDVATDAPSCVRPTTDATWVQPFVESAVGELAATPRASSTERDRARAYLVDQLETMGWQADEHVYSGGANVHATMPPTSGAEARIVVGAHFDSAAVGPGANDNASGVAAVLAVARFVQETPCRAAPVTIVLFDQEENGLVGSQAYAQTLAPVDVQAVYTIDQVAWDSDGDRVFELELPTPALESRWRAAAARVGASISVTSTTGTDHQSFRERGFAAVGLTEEYVGGDTSPHIHRATDTPASIAPHLGYLALAVRLATEVVLDDLGAEP